MGTIVSYFIFKAFGIWWLCAAAIFCGLILEIENRIGRRDN